MVTVAEAAESAAAATVTINGPPLEPTLSGPSCDYGWFSFSLGGPPGYRFAILTSTDLVNWEPEETNTAPFTLFYISDEPARFYRVLWVP